MLNNEAVINREMNSENQVRILVEAVHIYLVLICIENA